MGLENLKNNQTWAETLTDDQGGGGLLCKVCGHFEYFGVDWKTCPKCKRAVVFITDAVPYPYGGSDF